MCQEFKKKKSVYNIYYKIIFFLRQKNKKIQFHFAISFYLCVALQLFSTYFNLTFLTPSNNEIILTRRHLKSNFKIL